MTISGCPASLSLSTILRWTSSKTPTPGPGYGATPPPRTPPSLQNSPPKTSPPLDSKRNYCFLPRTFLTTLNILEAGTDDLEDAKDLPIADLIYSCCGAKDRSLALLLDLGLS